MNLRLLLGLLAAGLCCANCAKADSRAIKVGATPEEIVFRTTGTQRGAIRILEFPSHTVPEEHDQPVIAWEGSSSGSEVRLPRRQDGRDRLFSRFEVRDLDANPTIDTSHWVTDLAKSAARDFPFLQPKTKKGLNCVVDVADAVALGVQHANVNISMRALLQLTGESEFSTTIDGNEVKMNAGYVRHLDREIGGMTKAGINVTGILLNYFNPKHPRDSLIHPDTNMAEAPNKIGAFNVTSAEGLRLYRAAVQFLVERYTRSDPTNGWMSGLIIGNEVQSHWYWHNQGDTPASEVLRDYHLAVRIADLIGRSIHSRFRVYVSLDHHWTRAMTGFRSTRSIAGDTFLRQFASLCRKQGDFPWGLAFHPYPENLFEPRFWNDRRAPLALDAPVITFRNIEVLPTAMREEALLYAGKMRRLALTEQGFHRKQGKDGEDAQAAALALGYRKIDQIPEIEFFLLHRHQDHPHEGGLNLGVLDAQKNRTTAWTIYQAIDTPEWRNLVESALGTNAVVAWTIANLVGAIAPRRQDTSEKSRLVFDFYDKASEAELVDVADFRAGEVQTGASWSRAILQHPKTVAVPSRAKFSVHLPNLGSDQQLILETATSIVAPSRDGVAFRIAIDGEAIFSEDQQSRKPAEREIDLSRFAGRKVTVELVTDALGNTAHDLAAWVAPRIVLRHD